MIGVPASDWESYDGPIFCAGLWRLQKLQPTNLHKFLKETSRLKITLSRDLMTSPSICFSPEHRNFISRQGEIDCPKYVSCLWFAFSRQIEDGPTSPTLQGVYISPLLAEHDAVCWIKRKQRDAGCNSTLLAYSPTYEATYKGCFQYFTHPELSEEVQGIYWAFLTREQIHREGPRYPY